MKKIILLSLLLFSCSGRQDVVVSGEAKNEVTITLGFIDQLKELCSDVLLPVVYNSEAERRGAVAKCVFDNLAQIGKVPEIINICQKPVKTAEEQAICDGVGL